MSPSVSLPLCLFLLCVFLCCPGVSAYASLSIFTHGNCPNTGGLDYVTGTLAYNSTTVIPGSCIVFASPGILDWDETEVYYQSGRLYCSGMMGSLILYSDTACAQVFDYVMGPADGSWCLVRNTEPNGELTTVFNCAGELTTTDTSSNGQAGKTDLSMTYIFMLGLSLVFLLVTQQWC